MRVSDGGQLGLQLGQALLLRGGRLGPLPELALPLLELRLRGGHLRRPRVDLVGAKREALGADEILLEATLEVGQLGTRVLLARERLVELLPERVDLVEAGHLGGNGRLGRRRQHRRAACLRLRRRLVAVAPRLQLGPEAGAESLLDFVFAGCH